MSRLSPRWRYFLTAGAIALAIAGYLGHLSKRKHSHSRGSQQENEPEPTGELGGPDPKSQRHVPLPHGIGWRGDGSGVFPDANPPVHWSTTQSVVWRTPMPERSNASPVAFKDRIFVTAEPDLLLAVRASDGVILWQREAPILDALEGDERASVASLVKDAEAAREDVGKLNAEISELQRQSRTEGSAAELKSRIKDLQQQVTRDEELLERARPYLPPDGPFIGNSAQTPVVDGQNVFVAFGNGVVASFDLDGSRRWIRRVPIGSYRVDHGEPFGIGPSPLLAGDVLVVPMVKFFGLNPDTGQLLWTSSESVGWAGPARVSIGGTDLVVTARGLFLRARDGTIVREPPVPYHFTEPVLMGEVMLFSGEEPEAKPRPFSNVTVQALELSAANDILSLRPLWSKDLSRGELVSSPVVHDRKMFGINNGGGDLWIVDADRGGLLERRSVQFGHKGLPIASAAVAGHHIYVSEDAGSTVVLNGDAPYPVEASNQIDDTIRASPAFTGNRLYLRGYSSLYCISEAEGGQPKGEAPAPPVAPAVPQRN